MDWLGPGFGGASAAELGANSGFHGTPGQAGTAHGTPGRAGESSSWSRPTADIYPTLPMNANHFVFWQQHSQSFQAMAVMEEARMPLGLGGHPLQIGVLNATPGIFSVLDSMPRLGRGFSLQEAQPGHERVAVLMDNLWRQQFQSDPAILGKTITLNGFPYTVVGVMPPSFHLPHIQNFASQDSNHPQPVEALLPMAFSKDQLQEAMGDFDYFGLARLKSPRDISRPFICL